MRGLVARVGREWLMLAIDHVHEVLDAPAPTRLPTPAVGLEGVFALRGSVVPLWRADRLLGVEGDATPPVCVRLAVQQVHLGLLVDQLHGLVRADTDLGPSDAWWARGWLHLDLAGDAEMVTVVDAPAVVDRAGR